ncbi:DNA-processing protein DprA [Spiroplasma endosymbiont of Panorpa germanica]|uniref:DNA-processing protein DprA n=1 Tax=Spiroplasma endosymbiont of Panorpa germanica TaxID=3066314 RepID=UPI0030CF3FB6
MNDVILYFALKYYGNWKLIYKAIKNNEKILNGDLELIDKEIKAKSLSINNPLYPDVLREVNNPPFVIFHYGNIDLINQYYRCVGMVIGAKLSKYQSKALKDFVKFFHKNSPIMVIKIDNHINDSLKVVFNPSKKIILVVKEPLLCFLKSNADLIKDYEFSNNLLVISEFYEKTEASYLGPMYERIFTGISKTALVICDSSEHHFKQTITLLNDSGKSIFVLPEEIYKKSNNNSLIKEGALIVQSGADILNIL